MDSKLKQAYLYDFYGELLNEHQRKVYEDFFFHDLSLGEIAEEEGISRQGVHDLVKRCTRTLEEYESKLHLVNKFLYIRERIDAILHLVQPVDPMDEGALSAGYNTANLQTMKTEIAKISHEILEEL